MYRSFSTPWLAFVDSVRVVCILEWGSVAGLAVVLLGFRLIPRSQRYRHIGWGGVFFVALGVLMTEVGRFGHPVGLGRLWFFTFAGGCYLWALRGVFKQR